MTHHYGHPILVTTTPDGQPTTFSWRGDFYPILDVLASWHLQDRWWQPTGTAAPAGPPDHPRASDRTYYRVRCAGELYGELYHDAARDRWVLDRIYD